MEATRIVVPLPSLVAARTPRSRTERIGWAWFPTEIELPTHASVVRATVARPVDPPREGRDGTVRQVDAACASGVHWRRVDPPGTHDAFPDLPTPFVDHRTATTTSLRPDVPHVVLPLPPGPGSREIGRLTRRAFGASLRHDLDEDGQLAFRRALGDPDGPRAGRLTATAPFRLRGDVRARRLDPKLDDDMVDALVRRTAVVDGLFVVSSPPPRTMIVVLDRPDGPCGTLAVVHGHPDTVGVLGRDVVDLPLDPPWLDDLLDWTTTVGPWPGFDVVRVGDPVAGAVATPPAPFETLPRNLVDLAWRTVGHRIPGLERRSHAPGAEGVRSREAMAAAVLGFGEPPPARPGRTDHGDHRLRRIVWAREHVRRTFGPDMDAMLHRPAPDVLDALGPSP